MSDELEIVVKENGDIMIPLNGYGYILLEPLAKTSAAQHYSITVKAENTMCVSGHSASMFGVESMVKMNLFQSLESIKKTLSNVQRMLR